MITTVLNPMLLFVRSTDERNICSGITDTESQVKFILFQQVSVHWNWTTKMWGLSHLPNVTFRTFSNSVLHSGRVGCDSISKHTAHSLQHFLLKIVKTHHISDMPSCLRVIDFRLNAWSGLHYVFSMSEQSGLTDLIGRTSKRAFLCLPASLIFIDID